jgi:hypothetical protein
MRNHVLLITTISIVIAFFSATVEATNPSLSGAVTVIFTFHPDDPNNPDDFAYSSYAGETGSLTLAIPSVIETTIKPALIGPTPLNWDDTANWVQPPLDTSGLSIGQTGSGTYNATVNYGSSTLNVFRVGYGPSSFDSFTFTQVDITNANGTNEPPHSPDSGTVASNSLAHYTFNATIPTGAQVHTTGAANITLENLTVQSGGALLDPIYAVHHDFTNHGSASLGGTVEGNFINDALPAAGNTATVTGGFVVKGQLQNTGQIYVNPGLMEIDAATSNSGTLAINGGGFFAEAPFTNNGSMSLDNNGPYGYLRGSAAVTNNGTFQWTGGNISDIPSFFNSGSLTLSGSANKRIDIPFTNNGTISQSGTTPIIGFSAPFANQASALYDITDDSGLLASLSTFSNTGILRKSNGTGTSTFEANVANSGTIAVNTGTLYFPGSLDLTPTSTLQFLLQGTTPSTSFGKLNKAGSPLTLAGALAVTLSPGFSPALGNSFDLLDWDSFSGAFSSIALPPLAFGLKWDTAQLYTTGTISVAVGIPGDFNQNGIVDAADYVVWRKYVGTTYAQADYNTWRAHFGQTAGSGTSHTAPSIPEPPSFSMFILALLFAAPRRKSQHPH